jgi:glutathione S-transferase
MRLFMSQPSPFARKCRIVIREHGLAGRVEEIAVPAPYGAYTPLTSVNPIGQVPTLVDEDGVTTTNSPLICAYLDSIGEGPKLIPAEGPDHWRVRRLEVLGDSIAEMGVKLRLETLRPVNEQSPTAIENWKASLVRALDQAEHRAASDASFHLGNIAIVSAVNWVNFRFGGWDLGIERPALARLVEAFETRPSFLDTQPG